MTTQEQKFDLGRVVATRGLFDCVTNDNAFRIFVLKSLLRHQTGDWGDLSDLDRESNDRALTSYDRIFSAYKLPESIQIDAPNDCIWIVTEADRSATTLLWPDEY